MRGMKYSASPFNRSGLYVHIHLLVLFPHFSNGDNIVCIENERSEDEEI